jgi:hypothetical protein
MKIGSPTAPGTVVPAGAYTINLDNNGVDDLGGQHEFQLTGPGVNLSAGTNLYATATWSATFQPSAAYVFEDTLNPTTNRGFFGTPGSGAGAQTTTQPTTMTPPAPAPSPKPTDNSPLAPSAPLPFRGTLVGAVTAAGKLTLTIRGKPVASLKAGRYRITVTDASRKSGFTVQQNRKAATTITGIGFVGKHSVTVDLKTGQWFFYADFVGRKTYFLVHS